MAAGRVARIQITADTRDLAQKVEVARRLLQGLNKSEISGDVKKGLGKETLSQLGQVAKDTESRIVDLRQEIEKLSKATGSAFDPGKVGGMIQELNILKGKLKEIGAIRGSGGGGIGGGGRGGGGGGETGDVEKAITQGFSESLAGKIGKWVGGAAVIGTGIALWHRGIGIAKETQPMEAMAGFRSSAAPIGGLSKAGYDPAERRAAAAEFIRASQRKGMDRQQLSNIIDLSEVRARQYGVSQETQAALYGAGQVGGIGRGRDLSGRVMGTAQRMEMSGAGVTEYMQQMTGFLKQMADGMTIDDSSVLNIAKSIGDTNKGYFGTNAARSFGVMQGLNSSMTEADRPQQAMYMRTLQEMFPGLSPAAYTQKINRGIFSQADPEELKQLRAAGRGKEADMYAMGGDKVQSRAMAIFRKQISGLDPAQQDLLFNSMFNISKDQTGQIAGRGLRMGNGYSTNNAMSWNGNYIMRNVPDANGAYAPGSVTQTALNTHAQFGQGMDKASEVVLATFSPVLAELTKSITAWSNKLDADAIGKASQGFVDGAMDFKSAVINFRDASDKFVNSLFSRNAIPTMAGALESIHARVAPSTNERYKIGK